MGAFISNITEGFIGQTFLGCEALGSTNSAKLALEGNSYSHTMSYFAHYNYLGGEGYGSSYILEWFADFGWGGIAVGSFRMACAFYLLSRSNWQKVVLGHGRSDFRHECVPYAARFCERVDFVHLDDEIFGGARAGYGIRGRCLRLSREPGTRAKRRGCRTVSAVCGRSALCSASRALCPYANRFQAKRRI